MFKLNDFVVMKKPHACGGDLFKIIRVGVDIKIRCVTCGHEIMLERISFEKKLRRIIDEKDKEN